MENKNKISKPLFVKLRFDSIKINAILLLIVIPFAILKLFITERPQEIINEHSLLLLIVLPSLTLILNLLSSHTLKGLKILFGISFRENERKETYAIKPKMENLFSTPEDAEKYIIFVKKSISPRWINILSLIIGISAIIVSTIGGFTQEYDSALGALPYEISFTYYLKNPIWIVQVLTYQMFAGYLTMSILSIILMYMVMVFKIFKFNDFNKITIKKIRGLLNNKEAKDDFFEYKNRSEIVKFSINRFKKNCNSIPKFFLPINLLILTFVTIFALMASEFISNLDVQSAFFFRILLLIVVIIFLLMDFFLFLFPQLSLKNLIEEGKILTIETLEEIYESKKFQWLSMANRQNDDFKRGLWDEVQILKNMIIDIENLLVWPFNYKQALTLFTTSILPLIPFLWQFF